MKPISQFPPRRPNATRRLRRFGIAMLGAASFTLGASAPASALTFQEYIEYKIFVVQCALLLITDPVAHLEVCGVGDTSGMSSLSMLISAKPETELSCYEDPNCDYS